MSWGEDVYDWTKDYSMNMIIYGPPKTGKTYLAAEKAKEILEENPDSRVYVINTDKGWAKPAIQLGLDKYQDRIVYEYVNTIQKAIRVMQRFKEVIKPHDLIIFDLFSWVWDESQKEFINEISKGNITGFLANASGDNSKFGEFSGIQWQYIKRLDDHLSNPLTKNPICNVIAICRSKDVSTGYKIAGKEEDIWCKLGIPDARKDIAYEFANIIRIQKFKQCIRKFMVVASRDFDAEWKWKEYDTGKDFWKQIDAMYGGCDLDKPQDESGQKNYTKLSASDKKDIRTKIAEAFKDTKGFTIEDVEEIGMDVEISAIEQILEEGVGAGKLLLDGIVYSFPVAEKTESSKEMKDEEEEPEEDMEEELDDGDEPEGGSSGEEDTEEEQKEDEEFIEW